MARDEHTANRRRLLSPAFAVGIVQALRRAFPLPRDEDPAIERLLAKLDRLEERRQAVLVIVGESRAAAG